MLLSAVALVATACGPATPAAVVDGVPIERADLERLHPPDASILPEERASSLLLLILHRLFVTAAERDFGIVVGPEEIDEAFLLRASGPGNDLDERLANRGVTRERVRLEAELDVVRSRMEVELVETGAPGFDPDKAFRDFLAVHAVACLLVLTVDDPTVVAEIEQGIRDGDDIDTLATAFPTQTTRIDIGCRSPIEHGGDLASVALDGEVGHIYPRITEGDDLYLATVMERDAPLLEDVEVEVLELAVERQGATLFDTWAVGLIQSADVTIAGSLGSWAPAEGTGDIPTVLPN